MGYLIELRNQGSEVSRFLFSYQHEFDIYEDKLGLISINSQNQHKATLKVIYNLKKTSECSFSVIDSQNNTEKYKSYAELKYYDCSINVFYVSEQATLYSKIADIACLEKNSKFLLSCPKLDLNLKLPASNTISLGSSEFDSIVLTQKGIKPRHLEIIVAENIDDCEFRACLGQVEVCQQSGSKSFSINTGDSGMLEFSLSVWIP